MTAVAVVTEFDPLRDKTYRRAALGPDVVAFLAWLELGGAASRTLEDYERSLAAACRMYPFTPIDELTDIQLGQVFPHLPGQEPPNPRCALPDVFQVGKADAPDH